MRQQNTDLMAAGGGGRELALGTGPDVLDLAGPLGDGSSSSGDGSQVSLLQKLNLLLKDRYHWAIGLAVAGMLVGGAAGYLMGKPIYMSSGQIRVLPVLPKVLADGDDRGITQFFDSFVDSQVAVLQSQRVLDIAVQNEAWRAAGQSGGPDAVDALASSMDVIRPRGSQVIQVRFTHKEPAVAQAAVKSVVAAYKKISGEQDTESGEKLLEVVQQEQNVRANELAATRARILNLAKEFGTDDLQKKYDFELEELQKQEQLVRQLELQLASLTTGKAPTTREAKDISAEEIATRDQTMAQLFADRRGLERRQSIARQAAGPNSPEVSRLRMELTAVNEQIESRAAEYRKLTTDGVVVTPPLGGVPTDQVSPEVLTSRLDAVKALYEKSKTELLELGQKRLQIDALRQEEATIKDRLEVFKKRQEQLSLQDKVAGRIQIMSEGDRPTVIKNTKFRYTPAGAFGGASFGFGLVVLIGLLDRRFRSPEELRSSMGGSPMLGVLPELPDDLSDPEQAALTAHFVHQIRTLLQIWDSGVGSQVFSVTSPVSGTGKTSLTLALGVSFAAADSKTLLIDCDLVGGGLTNRANAIVKRKIGRILQREGLLSDKQLEEALKLASGSRRRLGEILVELGHLKEADLDSALVTQQKGSVGLVDVINGENLNDCVAETGIPGLSILPLGGATAQHASKVSPQALRRVLAEARKRYDTILVDTGPVPGSLEAAVVAAEVDGVILCVSRGEQRPLAEKCVQHLLTLGARVAGVVFNRAKTQDMSVYGTAVRTSMPTTSVPSQATAESVRFGPMARAMTYSGKADEAPRNKSGNEQD